MMGISYLTGEGIIMEDMRWLVKMGLAKARVSDGVFYWTSEGIEVPCLFDLVEVAFGVSVIDVLSLVKE